MSEPLPQPDLRTRLRELRKSYGWTLADVAERLGTTPQTISRLETNVMTVSTDWLQKFANLFGVSAAELISDGGTAAIDVIGTAARDGRIGDAGAGQLPLPLSLDDAVAVRAVENIGPYRAGTYLIATKLAGRNITAAKGHPCICETAQGTRWLARLIEGVDGTFTLVPLDDGEVQYDVTLNWAARVRLDVRFAD